MVTTTSTRTRGFPVAVFALALLLVVYFRLLFANTAMAAPASLAFSNVITSWTRRASPVTSRLVYMANGDLMRAEYSYVSDALHIEEFDSARNLVSSRAIDHSLIVPPGIVASGLLWGGFYEDMDAFWVVMGQRNHSKDDALPVIRVAKFD